MSIVLCGFPLKYGFITVQVWLSAQIILPQQIKPANLCMIIIIKHMHAY